MANEISELGEAILVANAALIAHAETHKCAACVSCVATLFEAMTRWVNGGDGGEEFENRRAQLQEVFGGKTAEIEKESVRPEGGEGEKDKADQAEDDWQKSFG